jgi:hypothetical protein
MSLVSVFGLALRKDHKRWPGIQKFTQTTYTEMNSLPKSEVDRIERAAQDYGEKSYDLFATTLNACQVCYFAGAKKEASTSMSKAIAFADWIRLTGFDIINSREKWYDPNLPYVHQVEYTTAELYALYSSQTETKL